MVTNSYIEDMANPIGYSLFHVDFVFAYKLPLTCQEMKLEVSEILNLEHSYSRLFILTLSVSVDSICIVLAYYFSFISCIDESKIIRPVRILRASNLQCVIDIFVDTAYQFKNCKIYRNYARQY